MWSQATQTAKNRSNDNGGTMEDGNGSSACLSLSDVRLLLFLSLLLEYVLWKEYVNGTLPAIRKSSIVMSVVPMCIRYVF
jgi:hypothetical protein